MANIITVVYVANLLRFIDTAKFLSLREVLAKYYFDVLMPNQNQGNRIKFQDEIV